MTDDENEDLGKQGHFFAKRIIKLIILNIDRSRLDQQREEAAEGGGYKRWMNAINVAVLSARSPAGDDVGTTDQSGHLSHPGIKPAST